MIKLLFLIFLSVPAFSAVKIGLEFDTSQIGQGELVETQLQIENVEDLKLQELKGKTVDKTVYFYDVSALIKRENSDLYEAAARVIFVKVPEVNEIREKINNTEVILNLKGIKVRPTQASPTLLFGTFDVPEKLKGMWWTVLGVLVLLFMGACGWPFYVRIKRRKSEKQKKLAIKNEIMGCRNYEDVVALWKRKHSLLQEFPHIQEAFLKLETTLYRHQFKPKQSEAEKIEVVEAYRKFSRSVEGGFNGI